jgi:mitochondrial-processing peptidase subunit alpha
MIISSVKLCNTAASRRSFRLGLSVCKTGPRLSPALNLSGCLTGRHHSSKSEPTPENDSKSTTPTNVASTPAWLQALAQSFGDGRGHSNAATTNDEYYKLYDYPNATEPPVIERTTAAEAALAASTSDSSSKIPPPLRISNDDNKENNQFLATSPVLNEVVVSKTSSSTEGGYKTSNLGPNPLSSLIVPSSSNREELQAYNMDPFDDMSVMTEAERQELRMQQRKQLPTSLSESTRELFGQSISNVPPLLILPNTAESSPIMEPPPVLISTLPNGIRVVTQDTYARQAATVGIVCNVGSRYETMGINSGVTHLLEMLLFGATDTYSDSQAIQEQLTQWGGGTRFTNCSREQSVLAVDVLRSYVPDAMALLAEVVCTPKFTMDEIQEAVQLLELQYSEYFPPEMVMSESIQKAAYSGPSTTTPQQLGYPHLADPETLLSNHERLPIDVALHGFWHTQFLSKPTELVVAGAGVSHAELVKLTEQHLGHLRSESTLPAHLHGAPGRVDLLPSTYYGGDDRRVVKTSHNPTNVGDSFVRVAVGLPVGGWHNDADLIPACVLQTLLGGGSSFSAGGPGKGMYTRLYRQVLNRHEWVESTEAFNIFHQETGMLGVSGSTMPTNTRNLVYLLCQQLTKLAKEEVSVDELHRARNMLKNNVLSQLESRFVLFEDLGRQVLTYGSREDMPTTVAKIEAVTAPDIQQVVQRALAPVLETGANDTLRVTFTAAGENLTHLPSPEEINDWIRL